MSNENSQNQVLGNINGRGLRVVRSGGDGGSDISITSLDSSILANGSGKYGIRVTGEFWTIDWLGGNT